MSAYPKNRVRRGSTLQQKMDRHTSAPNSNGCILWAASTTEFGYGQTWHQGHRYLAHRVAWELANGSIPEGMHVLHTCDVPRCCAAAHLWLGTNDDNVADMIAKGRQAQGESHKERVRSTIPRGDRHYTVKHTVAHAMEIKVASGSQREIAQRYGLSQSTVSDIKNGKHWATRSPDGVAHGERSQPELVEQQ